MFIIHLIFCIIHLFMLVFTGPLVLLSILAHLIVKKALS